MLTSVGTEFSVQPPDPPSLEVHGARDSSAGQGDAAIKAGPLSLEKITRITTWALFLVLEAPVEAKSSDDVLVLGEVNTQG